MNDYYLYLYKIFTEIVQLNINLLSNIFSLFSFRIMMSLCPIVRHLHKRWTVSHYKSQNIWVMSPQRKILKNYTTIVYKNRLTCAWRLFSLINKLLALTGGSVETPTPLPSVTNDTLTAWGASGTRPRPCTKRYGVPLAGQTESRKWKYNQMLV